ncbi:AI-2E family transporter [Balneolaceae bacterium ANBcel3]|nr:AI-2E family transporter [Balneolaceae bacterium ANBcel3]
MKKLSIESIVRFLLIAGLVVLLFLLLYRFFILILYALIALVLSYILDPVVNRMQSVGIHRTLATSMVIASIIFIFVWFSSSILPLVANQVITLGQQLHFDSVAEVTAQIEDQVLERAPFLPEGFLRDNIPGTVEMLFQTDDLSRTVNNILGLFANIFWAFLVIPFATFFLLKDGALLRRNVLQWVPNKYFETVLTGIEKVEKRLIRYFKGVGIQSIFIATLATLTLSVAGLNNALSVGIAVGVANIIPYFGPIIGYILSIIVSILETGDFSLVIFVVTAILITQIIDNVFVYPFLYSRTANLHPLVVLFVVLMGAELAGIFGMLIAVPVTVITVITIQQIRWSVENYNVFRTTDP